MARPVTTVVSRSMSGVVQRHSLDHPQLTVASCSNRLSEDYTEPRHVAVRGSVRCPLREPKAQNALRGTQIRVLFLVWTVSTIVSGLERELAH